MTLKLHNTLTGNIDDFIPQTPGKVLLYTCGPTVYNYPHVGNWSSYIYWDTLVRVLQENGHEVTRAMNITDVGHLTSDADDGEDKLEKSAQAEGKTAWDIAAFYTADFINGMKELGLIEPQFAAKATNYIPDQLHLVRNLKNKGFTYQIDDGIYFDTTRFPSYADFAHLDLAAQKEGARVEVNHQKRNSSDFALWKFTASDRKRDMEWETPTDLLENTDVKVMGFPGWHLECSAISIALLGETLDIHTGGIDHIPVHHTNEIAQSEAATGKKFSNYWLHNNFLKVNGTKISKSLKNGFTLQDIKNKGFSPIDFRMFAHQGHYRSEGNFTFEGLQSAKNRLNNWRNIAALRHQTHDTLRDDNEKSTSEKTISLYTTSQSISDAISNDLGTPEALRIIDDAFRQIINAHSIEDIDRRAFVQLLETIDRLLGLRLIETTPDISDADKQIILQRNSARSSQDWKKSDELRDQLLDSGIVLRDVNSGSIWEYKS